MLFEERELKPYAESIAKEDLKEGSVYFFVNFVDEEMLIPTIETVVFAGWNLDGNDAGQVYFQDIDSYRSGTRFETTGLDNCATFTSGSESQLGHVFDYEHALDQLLACSLRRRQSRI